MKRCFFPPFGAHPLGDYATHPLARPAGRLTLSLLDQRPRFRPADLSRLTARVFAAYGVPPEDARLAAEVLIDADLSGIESHGIAHLPWHPGYAPGFKRGLINPRPEVKVLRDSPVAATWDADGGLGVLVATKAMHACMAKAEATGIGMLAVTNGRHFGAAGYYARLAAERDMIGMAMCNVPPLAVASGCRSGPRRLRW